jgi:hypothetical protein
MNRQRNRPLYFSKPRPKCSNNETRNRQINAIAAPGSTLRIAEPLVGDLPPDTDTDHFPAEAGQDVLTGSRVMRS